MKSKVLWLMIKARPVWHSFVYNVNSRASHLGMSQKREMDRWESTTFLSSWGGVSDLPALTFIYFSPVWLLDTKRLGYRPVRTGKRVFRNCQSSKVREDRPSRFQGSKWGPETFARVSQTERSLPLASTHDGIQFPIRDNSVLFVEPSLAT